jgi:hypothetical protein
MQASTIVTQDHRLVAGNKMRFAQIVFVTGGIWGLLVVTPLFFLFDYVGTQYPPAITHPDFYYGFLTVTLAWQLAFLVIGRDPMRFRALMPVAMIEKFGYVAALAILHSQGRISFPQASAGIPDFLLGILFVVAFLKTAPGQVRPAEHATRGGV